MTRRLYFGLLMMAVVLALTPTVSAGDKEDVAAAAVEWTKLFVSDDPGPILQLYAKDAVLWGTLSPSYYIVDHHSSAVPAPPK
jgi:hypothetical protein